MVIEINYLELNIFNKKLEVSTLEEKDTCKCYSFRNTSDNIIHYSDSDNNYKVKPCKLKIYNNGTFELFVHFPTIKSWSQRGFIFDINYFKILE